MVDILPDVYWNLILCLRYQDLLGTRHRARSEDLSCRLQSLICSKQCEPALPTTQIRNEVARQLVVCGQHLFGAPCANRQLAVQRQNAAMHMHLPTVTCHDQSGHRHLSIVYLSWDRGSPYAGWTRRLHVQLLRTGP